MNFYYAHRDRVTIFGAQNRATTAITEIIKDLPIQSDGLQRSSVVHKLIHERRAIRTDIEGL